MKRAVLITRPLVDGRGFAEALAARGHKTLLCPLTEIIFTPQDIHTDHAQGLIATSANALRGHLKIDNTALPFFAVGETTAAAARAFGFDKIHIADGDEKSLADLVARVCAPDKGALIYLAGHERAGKLLANLCPFKVELVLLYHAKALAVLPPPIIAAFEKDEIGVVSFFSSRAAEIFVKLADGIDVKNIVAVGFSSAVAEKLERFNFFAIKSANKNTETMMDLILEVNQ